MENALFKPSPKSKKQVKQLNNLQNDISHVCVHIPPICFKYTFTGYVFQSVE